MVALLVFQISMMIKMTIDQKQPKERDYWIEKEVTASMIQVTYVFDTLLIIFFVLLLVNFSILLLSIHRLLKFLIENKYERVIY